MDALHSTFESIMAAAIVYGWRIDALALSVLLWIMVATYDNVKEAVAVQRLRPIVAD
jgi:hypothetical protein